MDLKAFVPNWQRDGFVILPGYLSDSQLRSAVAELGLMFPSAEELHSGSDEPVHARFKNEFGGIDDFPFKSTELNLLAVHPKLVALATELLETDLLRVYSVEAWAKYTGAADYDQYLHRDYLSQTMVVPSHDLRYQQVEMFLYLSDIPNNLGPPSFLSRQYTQELPAIPNWFPRNDDVGIDEDHPTWLSQRGSPEFYDLEVPASGPAGTVVAYANDTFHRGTAMSKPLGARYTIHVNFRPQGVDWISRHPWQKYVNSSRWHDFVHRAMPQQLELFGFPRPGHPYWTVETIHGVAQRYPGLDMQPWIDSMRG